MFCRSLIIAIAMAAACCVSPAAAQIVDFGKYPDLKGQWRRFVVPGIPGQQGARPDQALGPRTTGAAHPRI
jgi:hypothetical protein